MKTLFQSATPVLNLSGQKCVTFSLTGNGTFGNVVRTGWKESKLNYVKTCIIKNALESPNVDKVYRRGGKYYKLMLNGEEARIC